MTIHSTSLSVPWPQKSSVQEQGEQSVNWVVQVIRRLIWGILIGEDLLMAACGTDANTVNIE